MKNENRIIGELLEKLHKNETDLRSIYKNANGIIYTLSPAGKFVFVSQGWTEILGHDINEVQGQLFDRFVHSDDIPVCRGFLENIMASGEAQKGVEYRVRHCDGAWRWHTSSGAPVKDEAGKPIYYVGLAADITKRKLMETSLRLSEERFSKAFNASPVTMSITTLKEGRFIDINDSFCCIIGYSQEEVIGRTSLGIGFWVDPAERQKVLQRIAVREPVRELEFLFRKKSGEQRLGLYSAEGIDINSEQCLLSIVIDITERKQAEEEIKYLNIYDKLTGLYNRAFFEEELKRLDTERELPLSLIMGDVNGLKLVNDAMGHQEGDKLLITVAEVLQKSCRREDFIARWGGDEFIILLPGCDNITTAKIFERIKDNFQQKDNSPIRSSISLGMATKTVITQDIREVIKEAEDKMYRNKLLESRSMRSTFLMSLEKTLWSRSHETKEHCQRIQKITKIMGEAINLPDCELDNLRLLSALHDIGKIAIPNSILDNPGELSAEEWEVIKKHPEIGYRIALSSPEMAPIAEAILHHHEHWDGTGYPLGLKEENIPLISRIIAIADTYDVMINGRSYQKAVSQEAAWCEIQRCAGSQFDPGLVRKLSELHCWLKR